MFAPPGRAAESTGAGRAGKKVADRGGSAHRRGSKPQAARPEVGRPERRGVAAVRNSDSEGSARRRRLGATSRADERRYATGETLFALATAGASTTRASAYQKRHEILLATQRGDGILVRAQPLRKIPAGTSRADSRTVPISGFRRWLRAGRRRRSPWRSMRRPHRCYGCDSTRQTSIRGRHTAGPASS